MIIKFKSSSERVAIGVGKMIYVIYTFFKLTLAGACNDTQFACCARAAF